MKGIFCRNYINNIRSDADCNRVYCTFFVEPVSSSNFMHCRYITEQNIFYVCNILVLFRCKKTIYDNS